MWLSNQNCLHIHKILLLLITVQAQATPRFVAIYTYEGDFIRPTGSAGGLIDGIDKYVVRFNFRRYEPHKPFFPNNTIYPQKKFKGVWKNASCSYDVSLCPETFRECRCFSGRGDYFQLIYNATATIGDSGIQFRVVWESNSSAHQPVITDEVTLPFVCEQLKVTYTTQGKSGEAVFGETNKVEKESGTTSLTFEVIHLVPPYLIELQRDGIVVNATNDTTNVTTLTTSVTENDIGIEFTLLYNESSTPPACGRNGSVSLVYIPMPVVPTVPLEGMTPEDGRPTDSPAKPSPEKDEQGITTEPDGHQTNYSPAKPSPGKDEQGMTPEPDGHQTYSPAAKPSAGKNEQGMTPELDEHQTNSPANAGAEKDEQGSDTGMIIGVVLALVVGSLIGLILFATNSRATGVQAEAEGTGVQVNWSSALFPFKGETLVVNRKGAKDPFKSKDISKNESSVHSEDSKKHAASVNDLPPDTYTVSVVTNRWGWNTKSKATNFVVEEPGVEESRKVSFPVTTSTEFAQYGTVV